MPHSIPDGLFNWGARGLYWGYAATEVAVAHVPIPTGIQVTLFGQSDFTGELLHVFGASATNEFPTLDDVTAVNDIVVAWAGATYAPLLAPQVEILRSVATSVAEFPGPENEQFINTHGGGGGTQVQSQVTFAIKKAGVVASRRFRGRWFVWPFNQASLDDVDPNRIKSSAADDFLACFDTLRTSLFAADYPLCVLSRTSNPGEAHVVTGHTYTDLILDNQRRRGEGRGR